jgi:hypothetical protein
MNGEERNGEDIWLYDGMYEYDPCCDWRLSSVHWDGGLVFDWRTW